MKIKFKTWLLVLTVVAFFAWFILTIIAISLVSTHPSIQNTAITLAMILILLFCLSFVIIAIYRFVKSRQFVKKSFNGFVENIMTNNNIGFVIYDTDQRIVWTSDFIKNKFHKDFVGKFIEDFFKGINPNLKDKIDLNKEVFEFNNGNNIFQIQCWPLSNTIIVKDISTEHLFKVESWEQRSVIGEVEIDNYQMYQSILSEEQLFEISKVVIDTITEYMEKYNFIYRQYTNGKFVIITTEKSLKQMMNDKFDLFVNINDRLEKGTVNKLSLSAGFAHGWSSLKEKLEQSKKALLQAQNRGGDQVAIFSDTQSPLYFGSNNEILSNNSRTKIKLVASELENKLNSDNIKKVIIYGHTTADLDALGSAFGIYEIAKNYNKEVYICCETKDSTTNKLVEKLIEQDKLDSGIFINAQTATKITDSNALVIFVDNADVNRTDNKNALINADRQNVFVFDHHRLARSLDVAPLSNVYIDTTASSASEIIAEVITFMEYKIKVSELTAQLLLNGIYLDTAQFTKSTTIRTFEAAGWLESKGANAAVSGDLLKLDDDTENQVKQILKNTTEIKKGYFLAYSDLEVPNDVISIAANEILRIKGRVASFVVAKLENTNDYKLSARGINTNVQIICEQVGGGGHFSSAAAVSNEKLDDFIDNIRHAIISSGDN
ncbi:DHH family phosphoesterase [Mycoplasma nasistruthionis]|uniref:GGDEF domain-containing protein n=1 Tax=Mycoplasma nasistruthionis TaxID=353852 RepID=A0A4Y6I822_9MOLU|nr:DHH family phosphoesterase [Mycoplasma nasistruthionis]QCZ36777.1 hypothetical protein FG904_02015 [Mycoplasma nasistruthionis]QDF65058.1 hypothetical protein FIV53_02000 [Mycoplasma nasistruthionis]